MSISCPSLPLSLFDDIMRIDSKCEEGLKKFQSDLVNVSSKLKDNSKELEIIHRLFISLNERVNNTSKKDIIIDNICLKDLGSSLESKIDNSVLKVNLLEENINSQIQKSQKETKDYIDLKTEEIHSRLLKNLGFIYEQQLRAIKNEIFRPNPPVSPVITPVIVNKPPMLEEPWTKVDKKNYKPK